MNMNLKSKEGAMMEACLLKAVIIRVGMILEVDISEEQRIELDRLLSRFKNQNRNYK